MRVDGDLLFALDRCTFSSVVEGGGNGIRLRDGRLHNPLNSEADCFLRCGGLQLVVSADLSELVLDFLRLNCPLSVEGRHLAHLRNLPLRIEVGEVFLLPDKVKLLGLSRLELFLREPIFVVLLDVRFLKCVYPVIGGYFLEVWQGGVNTECFFPLIHEIPVLKQESIMFIAPGYSPECLKADNENLPPVRVCANRLGVPGFLPFCYLIESHHFSLAQYRHLSTGGVRK